MQARIDARELREKDELLGIYATLDMNAPGGQHVDEQNAVSFLRKYDSRSHGESFLDLFASRVEARGLYLLDEPEAPLSPKRQIALLQMIMGAAEKGAQFIIATHSPILLACPEARLYAFDRPPIREVAFDDLQHVSVMREFLRDPGAHLRAAEVPSANAQRGEKASSIDKKIVTVPRRRRAK